eukprot:m.39820 g.39820  ORF g.39820 m.39820 type:complete len:418 (+) comp11814_c0_seq2:28-1281(+)
MAAGAGAGSATAETRVLGAAEEALDFAKFMLDDAKDALTQAKTHFKAVAAQNDASTPQYKEAESMIAMARARFDVALAKYDMVQYRDPSSEQHRRARLAYDQAEVAYSRALGIEPPDARAPLAGNYRPRITVFRVLFRIPNAKNLKAIRGLVYKALEANGGCFLTAIDVGYEGDTLKGSALFMERRDAFAFQNWMLELPRGFMKVAVEQCTDPEEVVDLPPGQQLRRIHLSHYVPADSDSPCASLEELNQYTMAGPSVASTVPPTDPMSKFQNLEQPSPLAFVKMHIKDKARCDARLASDSSNIIAGSSIMHSLFDGNQVSELGHGTPAVKIEYVDHDATPSADAEGRYRVRVRLVFWSETYVGLVALKDGTEKVSDTEFLSFLHVDNPLRCRDSLRWRSELADRAWAEVRRELDEE